MIIGLGTDFWGTSIFILPENYNRVDAEFIPQMFKILPLVFSLGGAIFSFILYSFGNKILFQLKVSSLGNLFYNFLNKKWFFDKILNEYVSQVFFKLGVKF